MISLAPGYAQYVRSGIEFVVNVNGKIFLTDAAYCKLSGIPIGRVLDRLDEMQEGTYWHDIQISTTEGKKGIRLIPAETIFDWLLVDHRTVAERLARETDEFTAYSYRLASSTINQLVSMESILKTLKQQEKDIELLKEQGEDTAERVKAQEIKNLRVQEATNRQAEREVIEQTTNKQCDEDEDYLTVWQYLEDVGENDSHNDTLNDAIQLNDAAIIFCQNRDIEMKEIIRNKLGTVIAFPLSVLKQLDKKRETVPNDEPEHYFTIPQYLEEVRRKKTPVSLSEVIMMNGAAINLCLNKEIKLRETISNNLGTVYAFPISILQEVEKELFNARKN